MSNQHKPLTFLQRSKAPSEPRMSRNNTLLPRHVFSDDPKGLELHDTITRLRETATKHYREAARENAAAEAARTKHLRAVRDALSAGTDPGKLKDTSDKHRDLGQSHADLARLSENELDRVVREYALHLADNAAHLIAPSEERITSAAQQMRESINTLREAWLAYSRAWSERRILGEVAIYGGSIANYDHTGTLPTNVADALNTLTERLTDLDRLKDDEREVNAWHNKNAKARGEAVTAQ